LSAAVTMSLSLGIVLVLLDGLLVSITVLSTLGASKLFEASEVSKSKSNGGRENVASERAALIGFCSPSMWSGSGEGIWANGPGSVLVVMVVLYELARLRRKCSLPFSRYCSCT